MSDIRDDYLNFRVDDESRSSGAMSSVIKILVIILLLLLLVVLAGVAYKFLFKDEKVIQTQPQPIISQEENKQNTNANVIQSVTNEVENRGGEVKKEEIALIVKSILAQMNQEKNKPVQPIQQQPSASTTKQQTQEEPKVEKNPTQENDDATLLNNLSSADVDNVKEEDIDLSALDNIDSNQKIDNKKKKADNFNKVIIDKNEVATKDDLTKLYAKLNQIMKKDKTKVKSSNYVSKIKKETKVRKNAMRIITVRRGDTLSLIAKRAYGNPMMYNKIFAANPELIKNPNMIFPGQKLRVPK